MTAMLNILLELPATSQAKLHVSYADGRTEVRPIDRMQLKNLFREPTPLSNLAQVAATDELDMVAFWYPPQMVSMSLELERGEKKFQMLRVPMPGLVFKVWGKGDHTDIVAHKEAIFPSDDTPIFMPPLPNITVGGTGVCYGSQTRYTASRAIDISAQQVWTAFWEAGFNKHTTANKSVSFPTDVRLLLIDLHERKAKTFPHDELLPVEPRKASKKNKKDKNETMTLRDWLWR